MSKTFLVDATERIVASFIGGVVATYLAGAATSGINASTAHVLLIGGLAAAAATVKALVAAGLPTRGASLVPEKPKGRAKKRS